MMHRLRSILRLAAVAGAVVFAVGLATRPSAAAEPFTLISVADVARDLAAKDLKVFDANSPSTFRKGHLPGAVNVDYEDLTAGELPADKATRVVFYCKNRH